MSVLSVFGIADALAAPASSAPAPDAGSIFTAAMPMILIAAVMFYFVVFRPQNRQAKQQQAMMSELSKGDEVLTIGGIVGKISAITDEFVALTVAENTELRMKKSSIAKVLPKGTFKAIN